MCSDETPRIHGYASLRQFRDSKPEAAYFLTINLRVRGRGWEGIELTAQIRRQWEKLETEGWWKVRTATVMPDHLHLLVMLLRDHSLAECVRTFKGRLTPNLRASALNWQDGFYDHRVREPSDAALAVFLYIFLNPYRAGLLGERECWPGYYCRPADWSWFGEMTAASVPQPVWLR